MTLMVPTKAPVAARNSLAVGSPFFLPYLIPPADSFGSTVSLKKGNSWR